MQNGHQVEALDDFATAVREDPENSDVYHHRGQVTVQRLLHWVPLTSSVITNIRPQRAIFI